MIYRGASGKVVALDDRCCHRAAPLSMGRIEGDDIRCMYHGMKFEPGGKCIQIPGQDMIPPKLGVRSYPVVERYNLIWIWMGDIEKADPNLIVDYPPLADPKWRGLPGYMHYKANWLLIVDNLSDFAHLAFVHTHTLGGSEEYAYKTKPVAIEKLDDGFRVERWHMSADPPPYHSQGDLEQDRQDRSPQHRPHAGARHLPARHHVRAGRPGRGEGRPGSGHAAISQRPVHDAGDAQHARISSGTTCTISTSTIRTSRCRCATASKRRSTRIWRSSRRSRRCSTPIRTISCSRSAPTRR